MNYLAMDVQGLSKRYRIGGQEAYGTLRDSLSGMFMAPWRKIDALIHPSRKVSDGGFIWALKDVSFTVSQGEVLGIIGRNGAGKSTLLKILSRITAPTQGYAEIKGRVRSLLEVGTGFHQELTGRENIYLNGAILGMKRAEIRRRFDEIVAFAEVEKFVDTPVKHYSSGMYLRLAFAVAAHLKSEILLVDEVLAVGDASFQRKCLGKMGEVAHEGRTVLFVSHNMAAVRALCSRGLMLEQGKPAIMGGIESVLFEYSRNPVGQEASYDAEACFTNVRINDSPSGTIASGDRFQVNCNLQLRSALPGFRLFCIIQDVNGDSVVVAPTNHREIPIASQMGSHEIQVSFPKLWLRPGVYSLHFKLLGSTVGAGKSRFLSDSIMLDVTGSDDPEMLLGCLTPQVEWAVGRPAHCF